MNKWSGGRAAAGSSVRKPHEILLWVLELRLQDEAASGEDNHEEEHGVCDHVVLHNVPYLLLSRNDALVGRRCVVAASRMAQH